MTPTKNLNPVLDPAISPETVSTQHAQAIPPKPYMPPSVLSHSGEDVLEELGPTQACYPFSSCGLTP